MRFGEVNGLFSGFTLRAEKGSLTVLPLDFGRMDAVLDSVIRLMFAPEPEIPVTAEVSPEPEAPIAPATEAPPTELDFVEPVTLMLEALSGAQEKLCKFCDTSYPAKALYCPNCGAFETRKAAFGKK